MRGWLVDVGGMDGGVCVCKRWVERLVNRVGRLVNVIGASRVRRWIRVG